MEQEYVRFFSGSRFPVEKVDRVAQSAGDRVASAEGAAAEEEVKDGLAVVDSGFPGGFG